MTNAAFTVPVLRTSAQPFLLLDSGAYSAWNTGGEINFDRYAAYVREVKDLALAVINLDVIPGARGSRPTRNQIRDAGNLSYERWLKLKESGALVAPVFHQGDDARSLAQYLDDGAAFIGISPSDAMPDLIRKRWLLDVHDELDRQGVGLNTAVFTHVLGLFSPPALMSLKGAAWSADASTVMQHTVRFRLMLPLTDGKITTTGPFDKIQVCYAGEKGDVPDDNAFSAAELAEYLSAVGHEDNYKLAGDRVVIDNVHALASINIELAHRLNYHTRVRQFVAGPDLRVLRQLFTEQHYPYRLETFAGVTETTGASIRKYFPVS